MDNINVFDVAGGSILLAANSPIKRQSEERYADIRESSSQIQDNGRSTTISVMYLIDKLGFGTGNENGEDEAGTIGCCSLHPDHVTLEAPDWIILDLWGEDSTQYYNKIQVEPPIYKNFRIFMDNKYANGNLFDRVTSTALSEHLASEMEGLTAKVFHIFNASITLQRLLDAEELENAAFQKKLTAYDEAYRQAASLYDQHTALRIVDKDTTKLDSGAYLPSTL
ncbi:eukaryotic DNA topoisomerase I [Panaeolus papilionaceus]|nr:eukaryotic DNA topoisomerase I [Panaeolus papilionaceus]